MWFAVIVFVLMLILLGYLDAQKPKNYPPGPKWLPILGSALAVRKGRIETGYLRNVCYNMTKEYSDKGVLGLRVGKDRIVIAGTRDSIREMLTNEDLDGRPQGPFYETRTWGQRLGIVLTDEDLWKEHRRFILRHLKEFGFGRHGMTELIQREAEQLLLDVKNKVNEGNGTAVIQMHDYFSVYVLNALWSMMAGIRYSKDDSEMSKLQKLLFDLFANIDMVGTLFSHYPLLRFIAPNLSGYNRFIVTHQHIWKFLGDEIDNHKKAFKEENEDRDFMDVYIRLLKTQNKRFFNEKQLMAVCLDLFMAGSETTSKSLGFAFYHLVKYQHVQAKAQAEIDSVVGRDRLPTLEDRVNLPYNDAVMMESVRHFMGRTFGIPHRALRDTKLCGYSIPKDTMVIANFYGVLMDDDLFPDAHDFNPERFLVNGKVQIPENYFPFGLGKHRCMGEILAKSNIFLYVVTMLQNFSFNLPPGHPPLDGNGLDGATPSANPYFALVTPRPMLID